MCPVESHSSRGTAVEEQVGCVGEAQLSRSRSVVSVPRANSISSQAACEL